MTSLKRGHSDDDLPAELRIEPLEKLGYLVEYLFEAGASNKDGPLSWQELSSWQRMTGSTLSSWEAIALRELSVAYHTELLQASDPARPSPRSITKVDKMAVANKIKAAFATMKKAKK